MAQPWSLWSLSFLELRIYMNIALGCCWEREGRRRLTHTATSMPTPLPHATWPHTLTPTLSAFMQALTPTHAHTHTPCVPACTRLTPLTPTQTLRSHPRACSRSCSVAQALPASTLRGLRLGLGFFLSPQQPCTAFCLWCQPGVCVSSRAAWEGVSPPPAQAAGRTFSPGPGKLQPCVIRPYDQGDLPTCLCLPF